jgi:hypothetical protein
MLIAEGSPIPLPVDADVPHARRFDAQLLLELGLDVDFGERTAESASFV